MYWMIKSDMWWNYRERGSEDWLCLVYQVALASASLVQHWLPKCVLAGQYARWQLWVPTDTCGMWWPCWAGKPPHRTWRQHRGGQWRRIHSPHGGGSWGTWRNGGLASFSWYVVFLPPTTSWLCFFLFGGGGWGVIAHVLSVHPVIYLMNCFIFCVHNWYDASLWARVLWETFKML